MASRATDNRRPAKRIDQDLADAVTVTRFWMSVDIRGDDECWPWKERTDSYGLFLWQGELLGAHRLALTFATGEALSEGLQTLHSCDNKVCCNPNHLRFGTPEENAKDFWDRCHRKAPTPKFDPHEVEMIRKRREAGASAVNLAKDYNVSVTVLLRMTRGKTYKNAPGPITD